MTAVADPCELCCWWKDRNPSTVVMCSGAENLCKFKYEFFAEWQEMLLDCDTLEKYAQLMDIIFSVNTLRGHLN